MRREVYDDSVEMREVVVELQHPREGDVATRRAQFDDRCRDLEDRIRALGGEIVGKAWINSTLLVRIPSHAVHDLENVEGVERIDVPHKITRE